MSRMIDADKLSADMYHEAFEKDSDMQKWDSGCWIRYKMFENVLKAQPIINVPDINVGSIDTTTHDSIPAKTGGNDEDRTSDDLVSRQAVKDIFTELYGISAIGSVFDKYEWADICETTANELPSVQPTLYGYNIEHLELIARVLQKEDLPPERVAEVLINIGEIVAIVRDEFEETLRRAVEQCTT